MTGRQHCPNTPAKRQSEEITGHSQKVRTVKSVGNAVASTHCAVCHATIARELCSTTGSAEARILSHPVLVFPLTRRDPYIIRNISLGSILPCRTGPKSTEIEASGTWTMGLLYQERPEHYLHFYLARQSYSSNTIMVRKAYSAYCNTAAAGQAASLCKPCTAVNTVI